MEVDESILIGRKLAITQRPCSTLGGDVRPRWHVPLNDRAHWTRSLGRMSRERGGRHGAFNQHAKWAVSARDRAIVFRPSSRNTLVAPLCAAAVLDTQPKKPYIIHSGALLSLVPNFAVYFYSHCRSQVDTSGVVGLLPLYRVFPSGSPTHALPRLLGATTATAHHECRTPLRLYRRRQGKVRGGVDE